MKKGKRKGVKFDLLRKKRHDSSRRIDKGLTHATNPWAWTQLQVNLIVIGSRRRGNEVSGWCLTLTRAARAIARATYSLLRNSNWGPGEYTVIRQHCSRFVDSPFYSVGIGLWDRTIPSEQFFRDELTKNLEGNSPLGSSEMEIYLIFCFAALEWAVKNPATAPGPPPRDPRERTEKPA